MITIYQMLKNKGSDVWSVRPETPLKDALAMMAEKEIGAVLVLDGEQKVVGIFSERDFARHAVSGNGCSLAEPVSTMMTEGVYYVGPDQTTEECMALMTQKHFRHLPVLDGDRLVGVISIGDVVKWTISEKEIEIRGLENYILGREYSG